MATLLQQTITKRVSPVDKESIDDGPALTKHYGKQENRGMGKRSWNNQTQSSVSQAVAALLGLAVCGGRGKVAGNDSKLE